MLEILSMKFIDSAYDLESIKKWHIQQHAHGMTKTIQSALIYVLH